MDRLSLASEVTRNTFKPGRPDAPVSAVLGGYPRAVGAVSRQDHRSALRSNSQGIDCTGTIGKDPDLWMLSVVNAQSACSNQAAIRREIDVEVYGTRREHGVLGDSTGADQSAEHLLSTQDHNGRIRGGGHSGLVPRGLLGFSGHRRAGSSDKN